MPLRLERPQASNHHPGGRGGTELEGGGRWWPGFREGKAEDCHLGFQLAEGGGLGMGRDEAGALEGSRDFGHS